MIDSYIMPTVYKPNLLHILCNDIEYEKEIFNHLDHQQSHVSQTNTKAKQITSNESNVPSLCIATHYADIQLFVLGNYKTFFLNNDK